MHALVAVHADGMADRLDQLRGHLYGGQERSGDYASTVTPDQGMLDFRRNLENLGLLQWLDQHCAPYDQDRRRSGDWEMIELSQSSGEHNGQHYSRRMPDPFHLWRRDTLRLSGLQGQGRLHRSLSRQTNRDRRCHGALPSSRMDRRKSRLRLAHDYISLRRFCLLDFCRRRRILSYRRQPKR